MKFLVALVACFAGVLSYEPSGWKPQGALLAQQTLYGPPTPPTTPTTENATAAEPSQDGSDLEKVNENIMERLRQQQGADFGSYFVYLPDGRLQKVQYTTAPLRAQASVGNPSTGQQGSYQNNQQFNQQAVFGSHQVNSQSNAQSFGKYRGDYQTASNNQDDSFAARFQAGNPSHSSSFRLVNAQNAEDEAEQIAPAQKSNNGQVQLSNYVASVQFTDVQPIPGPIYTLNSAPLVRIVRYAPAYQ